MGAAEPVQSRFREQALMITIEPINDMDDSAAAATMCSDVDGPQCRTGRGAAHERQLRIVLEQSRAAAGKASGLGEAVPLPLIARNPGGGDADTEAWVRCISHGIPHGGRSNLKRLGTYWAMHQR